MSKSIKKGRETKVTASHKARPIPLTETYRVKFQSRAYVSGIVHVEASDAREAKKRARDKLYLEGVVWSYEEEDESYYPEIAWVTKET